jgi:hypothetical protein
MSTGIHRIHQSQGTSNIKEEEAAKKYSVKVDNRVRDTHIPCWEDMIDLRLLSGKMKL